MTRQRCISGRVAPRTHQSSFDTRIEESKRGLKGSLCCVTCWSLRRQIFSLMGKTNRTSVPWITIWFVLGGWTRPSEEVGSLSSLSRAGTFWEHRTPQLVRSRAAGGPTPWAALKRRPRIVRELLTLAGYSVTVRHPPTGRAAASFSTPWLLCWPTALFHLGLNRKRRGHRRPPPGRRVNERPLQSGRRSRGWRPRQTSHRGWVRSGNKAAFSRAGPAGVQTRAWK